MPEALQREHEGCARVPFSCTFVLMRKQPYLARRGRTNEKSMQVYGARYWISLVLKKYLLNPSHGHLLRPLAVTWLSACHLDVREPTFCESRKVQ